MRNADCWCMLIRSDVIKSLVAPEYELENK